MSLGTIKQLRVRALLESMSQVKTSTGEWRLVGNLPATQVRLIKAAPLIFTYLAAF